MPDRIDEIAAEADELALEIRPLLHARDPVVISAALAAETALWLAGYVVPGDRKATTRMRKSLLETHFHAVRELVPAADLLIQRQLKIGAH